MMCVESRGPPVWWWRGRQDGRPGSARRSASRRRHTAGIAGHRHSRAVAIRSPSPTTPNTTFADQIATAAGMRVRSAAPSSDVIVR